MYINVLLGRLDIHYMAIRSNTALGAKFCPILQLCTTITTICHYSDCSTFGSMSAVSSYLPKAYKKSGASICLILSVGLGLPCNTDKENEQTPLGCISCYTIIQAKKSVLLVILILHGYKPTCEVSKFTLSE